MKILVYGAGVIGTLYAARLQEGGHRVTAVARGQRLADIRRYGLAPSIANPMFDEAHQPTSQSSTQLMRRLPIRTRAHPALGADCASVGTRS